MQQPAALFDDYEYQQKTMEPTIKTYPVDPLALVIHSSNESASSEHWADSNAIASALTNPESMSRATYLISEAAIDKAQEIRDFYKQKYAYVLMMGEETLTPFQTSLMKFLSADNKNSLDIDHHIGMVISLPRLYEEDHKIFEIMKQFVEIPTPTGDKQKYGEYYNGRLTFVKKRSTKFLNSAVKHDYWFKNTKGHLFRIVMPTHTMESNLMDKVLDLNNNTIDFSGTILIKKLFGNNFYYAHIYGKYDI